MIQDVISWLTYVGHIMLYYNCCDNSFNTRMSIISCIVNTWWNTLWSEKRGQGKFYIDITTRWLYFLHQSIVACFWITKLTIETVNYPWPHLWCLIHHFFVLFISQSWKASQIKPHFVWKLSTFWFLSPISHIYWHRFIHCLRIINNVSCLHIYVLFAPTC